VFEVARGAGVEIEVAHGADVDFEVARGGKDSASGETEL